MAQFIPVAISAASALVDGYQKRKQADGAAKVFDAQATASRQAGAANEEVVRRRNAQAMGDVRATAAESGFDPNSGTLADLQSRTAGELELDALTARYKGQLEALGLTYQGDVLRAQGRNAVSSGLVGASAYIGSAVARDYLRRSQIQPTTTTPD